jgi:hypothetical protein
MKRLGKKGKEWLEAKPKLIQIYLKKGVNKCEISGSKFALDFHHILKRSSQKAEHTFEGTRLLSQEWHDFCEHDKEANKLLVKKPRGFDKGYFERFKKMREEKKKKTRKADWSKPHQCVNCKTMTSMYICHNCGKVSIK